MDGLVKQELVESADISQYGSVATPAADASSLAAEASVPVRARTPVIELSSSSGSSSSDSGSDNEEAPGKRKAWTLDEGLLKRIKSDHSDAAMDTMLPAGFLSTLPPPENPSTSAVVAAPRPTSTANAVTNLTGNVRSCKQFWKAGDYEGGRSSDWASSAGGIDHVRVHPKFLHSNATSHKWALGAFAELLDNALDEVGNGATYVNVDVLENKKDGNKMLLVEDNGGGMTPDKIRHCMSLGYSAKSKVADAIGQYGNGFKTSTMRLGADVIVFSRCHGKDGKRPTQSIGLLSYTFLRGTGQEDIIVPMLDYERVGGDWNKIVRSTPEDWKRNVETVVQWSPFYNEEDLLRQFHLMRDQGTRIIIYNLWEDDEGQLELDFNTDPHDIQLRGVNREEKNIQMANEFPNSRHFLTYRHSLRNYASILYLRLPPGFRIILRGKDVEQHNIVNDMMLSQKITYRPQSGANGIPRDSNMAAVVTIGFVKDAKQHIDVQGFNVYHKNRLIKPFWRLWNAAGSDGRGVIGVLEANFVEPAHDKQGFERTTALARLEIRLKEMQKNYWYTYCHLVGYAPRRNKKSVNGSADRENSPDNVQHAPQSNKKYTPSNKTPSPSSDKYTSFSSKPRHFSGERKSKKTLTKRAMKPSPDDPSSPSVEEVSDDDMPTASPGTQANGRTDNKESQSKESESQSDTMLIDRLREENQELRKRLERTEGEIQAELQRDLTYERDRCKLLETQLQDAQRKIEEVTKEQETLIEIFSEERERRDREEEHLRKKLKDASNTIQELLDKIRLLERMKSQNCKTEF